MLGVCPRIEILQKSRRVCSHWKLDLLAPLPFYFREVPIFFSKNSNFWKKIVLNFRNSDHCCWILFCGEKVFWIWNLNFLKDTFKTKIPEGSKFNRILKINYDSLFCCSDAIVWFLLIAWQREVNTAWKVSVFGVFLVCIFLYSDWIRRDTGRNISELPITYWIQVQTL